MHRFFLYSAAATADQQRDFFTEFFNVQFSGSTDSLQVNLSFGIIPDDILESNEGFFVTLELDSSLSDPDTVQELTITRNTSLVQILNDDCKYYCASVVHNKCVIILLYTIRCIIIVCVFYILALLT